MQNKTFYTQFCKSSISIAYVLNNKSKKSNKSNF